MSQWGGLVSILLHQTFRPAMTATTAPRRTGIGTLGLSNRARSRSPALGAAAAAVRVTSTANALALGPAQAEDGKQERREEDLHPDDDEGRREDRHALL